MATITATDKSKPPKKPKAKKKKLGTLKLLKTFIILIFVLLLINLFLTIQQQSVARKDFQLLKTQLHNFSVYATKQWQQIEKKIDDSNAHWTALTKLEVQVPQWQKQAQQSFSKLSQQVQQLQSDLKQQTQQLTTSLHKLASIKLSAPSKTTTRKSTQKSRDPGYQTNDQYRIFGVEPYGVILVGPKGEFTVARIGKLLGKLGEITAISKDRVIAGKYIIHP